jgi:hypothetical protein
LNFRTRQIWRSILRRIKLFFNSFVPVLPGLCIIIGVGKLGAIHNINFSYAICALPTRIICPRSTVIPNYRRGSSYRISIPQKPQLKAPPIDNAMLLSNLVNRKEILWHWPTRTTSYLLLPSTCFWGAPHVS